MVEVLQKAAMKAAKRVVFILFHGKFIKIPSSREVPGLRDCLNHQRVILKGVPFFHVLEVSFLGHLILGAE